MKYTSLHHLNPGWQSIVDPPEILRKAMLNNLFIIHLKRSNYVSTLVSGMLADKNKIWHTTTKKNINQNKVILDIPQVSRYLLKTDQEVKTLDSWLYGYKNLLVLEYSDLFDDKGDIQPQHLDNISRGLAVNIFKKRSPHFVKQAPNKLSDSVGIVI